MVESSSRGKVLPSRRAVLVQTLSSGFALAVSPAAAATITTAESDLEAGEVKIPTSNGEIPAYRAHPKAGSGRLPVILVVHEIFGVHEHIKDVVRRLAKAGYFAVAPELFARQGDVSKLKDIPSVQAVVAQVPDAQVMSDLDSTVGWAKKQPRADVSALTITGFCWGGRIVWLYSAHQPALRGGVAWYGKLTGERDDKRPRFPIDVVSDLKARVLGLYGAKDQGISVESVQAMQKALAESSNPAAKASSIHLYPDAGHAFFADYRPSYHAASAQDGWQRLLAWLSASRGK